MTESTMTMTDIAHLCGVSRPLVSMWRRRTMVGGREVLFPNPVTKIAGAEHFDAEEVRAYLQETGRGKNPDAELEAPALAPPEGAAFEDLVTLLCLRELVGDDIGDQDLTDLANQVDPGDQYVEGEIVQVDPRYASYIDELRAMSFGPADALDRLEATRTGRTQVAAELTTAGVALVATLAEPLLVHLGPDRTDLVDGSAGQSTVGLELARELGRGIWIGDDGPGRPVRRRALLAGVDLDERGRGAALRVDGVLGLNDNEALERADLLEVELGPDDVGFLLGPARILADQLRDERARDLRDDQVQAGHVRAVVRLPRGMYRAAVTQSLALWVLDGKAVPGRSLLVADLGDRRLRDIVVEDLANDLVAALANPARHHFRYLQPRAVTEIIGRRVVPRGFYNDATISEANPAGRFLELARSVSAPVPVVTVEEGGPRDDRVTRTIYDLRTGGDLIVRSGSRLDLAWATPGGTVATIGVESWRDARFDPLDLEERAPNARRTEPRDVVITTSPPHAVVDTEGGRVVPTPARILRLGPKATIGPHALAAQINRLPKNARDLDAWRVQLGTGVEVERRLAAAAALRADLLARADALDDLTQLLLDGDAGLTFDLELTTDRNSSHAPA